MKRFSSIVVLIGTSLIVQAASPDLSRLVEPARAYVTNVIQSFDSIPEDRRGPLQEAADFIVQRVQRGNDANLSFICTHNSRRSHMSQVWLEAAATSYGIPNVHTYSGGVEVNACNIRTVRAMRRAGLSVAASTGGTNPVYLVQFADGVAPVRAYSKAFNAKENPQKDYAALMCCADADKRCPVVTGSSARIAIHYDDPKISDGTSAETATYDERCKQIATEMFYIMSLAADGLKK